MSVCHSITAYTPLRRIVVFIISSMQVGRSGGDGDGVEKSATVPVFRQPCDDWNALSQSLDRERLAQTFAVIDLSTSVAQLRTDLHRTGAASTHYNQRTVQNSTEQYSIVQYSTV